MKLIFDSTPLIYFAKLDLLQQASKIKGDKIIPAAVYAEVVETGKEKGKQDAFIIESLVNKNAFKVEKADDKTIGQFIGIKGLSRADAEILAMAKDRKAVAVIDESILRTIAGANGIVYRGSVFLLFQMYRENLLKKSEIKKCIDSMIKLGWRCSTELYAAVLEEINRL